jgi:acetyl-CoA C-acetyltransferase
MSESFEHQTHGAAMASDWAGLLPIPAIRTENACASSGAALRCGIIAIKSGLYDIVLVGGIEKMTHQTTDNVTEILAMASDFPLEQWNGITFPGIFAMMAVAHMHRYGTTEEQLAEVAVKNHENALENEKAHLRKKITIEDVLNSRPIAWPLKLYDCSPISDGASCLILASPKIARKFTDTPVHIIASAQAQDTLGLYEREDLTSLSAVRLAANQAYKMARIKPGDVDLAEVHDCFTIAEIIAYEDLLFCKPGKGGTLIHEGITSHDGRLPVNTSGGLKAKGHPVGATGVAQACEIFLQLSGQAGRRQVPGVDVGLTHNVGGSGSTAIVHIYRRGD